MALTNHTIDSQASLRRTAILLSTLGEATARKMLGNLPPLKRAMLRRTIAELSDVDPLERRQAMREFLNSASSQPAKSAGHGADVESVSTSEPPTPLSFLGSVPDQTLLKAIQDEHPQTIAIVLASLRPEQAARLIAKLDTSTRNAAVQRLAKLDQLPPDALDPIGEHLRKLVNEAGPTAPGATGSRTLAAILEQVPGALRRDVNNALGWENPEPSESEIREDPPANEAVFQETDSFSSTGLRLAQGTQGAHDTQRRTSDREEMHEQESLQIDHQLARLTPTELRDGLAKLDGRQAMLAMCGLPARLADRILATVPRRQARQIRQQLQNLESVTLKEIDLAKRELALSLGLAVPPSVRQASLLSTAA